MSEYRVQIRCDRGHYNWIPIDHMAIDEEGEVVVALLKLPKCAECAYQDGMTEAEERRKRRSRFHQWRETRKLRKALADEGMVRQWLSKSQ